MRDPSRFATDPFRAVGLPVLAVAFAALVLTGWQSAAAEQTEATVRVGAGGAQYVPSEVTIPPGGTVVFRWEGNDAHSVRHVPGDGSPRRFDSHPDCGPLLRHLLCGTDGHVFRVTLDDPGTYPFGCQVHEQMVGVVRVAQPPPPAPDPDPDPAPQPPVTAPPPGDDGEDGDDGAPTVPSAGSTSPLALPDSSMAVGTDEVTDDSDVPDVEVAPALPEGPPSQPDLEPFPEPARLPDVEVALPVGQDPRSRTVPMVVALVGLLGAGTAVTRAVLAT